MALSLDACQALLDKPNDRRTPAMQNDAAEDANPLSSQGCTINSALHLTGIKVFSNAAFKCSKTPGRGLLLKLL